MLYLRYPLKQGLRRDKRNHPAKASFEYLRYPLKQGLRPHDGVAVNGLFWLYLRYPLKQGLRRYYSYQVDELHQYLRYPLKQGLRHIYLLNELYLDVFTLSIKTRIKTLARI